MNLIKKQIKDRMSLRKPQEEALGCLERLTELLPMKKGVLNPMIAEHVSQAFPGFKDFERNFPNVCFAIATGVGKTRLMGAMIAYLAEAKGIRNFVVIAPNTTITEKLVREFSQPKHAKYVFKGLPEFAHHCPRIVTGENYEEGSGLIRQVGTEEFNPESITISIFNIALLHTKDRRIRRPNEKIHDGMSPFDHLATRTDLVVFMDEAHHCRAKAGAKTIEELNPILGIELTATPQIQSSKGEVSFSNVIYRFALPEALKQGFVKKLGIGGRSNFDCSSLSEEALERLKLEDGLTVHRNLQAELWGYTSQRGIKPVKPFVLVIAKDTTHANQIEELIKNPTFLSGRYANKVLTVHSQQNGEEKEETVRQLLAVESPENPIEIVIHVNMLREGWDVTNLYTIVPLRKAKSLTLIEQSMGRGARLPFGRRTGIDLIDRLYIVYHENFQKVVLEAEKYLEVIEKVDFGKLPVQPPKPIIVHPMETSTNPLEDLFTENKAQRRESQDPGIPNPGTGTVAPLHYIKIPRIMLQPDPNAKQGRFPPFTLNLHGFGPQPDHSSIIITDLITKEKIKFYSKISPHIKQTPEEIIAQELLDYDQVADTEENAYVVTDLAQQMVRHLNTYLSEEMTRVVVHQHKAYITNKIYQQMVEHYEPGQEKMIHAVSKEFLTFKNASYLVPFDQEPEHYNRPLKGKKIESILWSGFEKSIYPMMKFDSDAERQLAAILESDEDVISWVKPPKGQFWMYYQKDTTYEPDFVIETKTGKYLCEVKDRTKIEDPIVQEKAHAASCWCQAANESTDKEWKYLLIPDNAINPATTFAAYANRHEWRIQT